MLKNKFSKANILRAFLLIIYIAITIHLLTVGKAQSHFYSYDVSDFSRTDNAIRSPQSSIFSGKYDIDVVYTSDRDIAYCIQLGSDDEIKGTLPAKPSRGAEKISFVTDADCDNMYIIFYDSTESMQLTDVILESANLLNIDAYIRVIILSVCFIITYILIGAYPKFTKKDKQVLFILVGTVIFLNLIHKDDSIRFSGDIRFHLTRINGIKNAIESGQFPAILFPNSFNGHGEIGALYPNLFLYPLGFMRACGVSLMMTNKILLYVTNILTVLFTYACSKKITDNKLNAAIATAVYSLFPYRMFVMTASGSAAGRGLALMFLPLFVIGIFRLVKTNITIKENKVYYINSIIILAIGASGILNSHVLCFIMALVFAGAFCLLEYKRTFRKDTIISLFISGVLCFILGLTTISLLLGYINSGLNIGYLEHDLYLKLDSPLEFIQNPWTIYMFTVVFITLFIFHRNKKKLNRSLIISLIAIFTISILTLNIIPYNCLMNFAPIDKILSTFQNMKRLYFVSIIFTTYCVLKTLEISKEGKQKKLVTLYVFITLLICSFLSCRDFVKSDTLADSVVAYTEHEGALEYLPEGTTASDFTSNAAYVSNEGALNVIFYDKQGYNATVYYTCSEEGVYAELPMFYYRDTKCEDENGNQLPVTKGNKNHVRIYFDKTDTVKYINVLYRSNPIYTLLFALSVGAYAVLFIAILIGTMRARIKARG